MDMQQQIIELQKSVDWLRQRKPDRVVILVDHSNFTQSWRRIDSSNRPDYSKLQDFLVGNRWLRQARLYYSEVDEGSLLEEERQDWQKRQDFYSWLRHHGWFLRSVRKRVYEGGSTEKGLDCTLNRDMEILCRDNRCDTIILVAGDADYCNIVADVQDRYCMKVEVAFFPAQTSRDLRHSASVFIDLESEKEKFIRRS